jgi:hypothetical protein
MYVEYNILSELQEMTSLGKKVSCQPAGPTQ